MDNEDRNYESCLPDAAGFFLGLTVPVLVGWFVVMIMQWWFYHLAAGFFSCLLTAGILVAVGKQGWNRSGFYRGLAGGAGIVLVVLPIMVSDCKHKPW